MTSRGVRAPVIRNCDLDFAVPVHVILEVLEEHFPAGEDTYFTYRNPEGFGGHYVQNEEILDVVPVVKDMIRRAEDSTWKCLPSGLFSG